MNVSHDHENRRRALSSVEDAGSQHVDMTLTWQDTMRQISRALIDSASSCSFV